MFVIFLLLITGICLGLAVRRLSAMLKLDVGMMTLTVYFVLFIVGISTGCDEKIVRSLDCLGLVTIIIIVGTLTVSSLIIWFLYKFFSQKI
jgi:hypothetical protein